MNKANFGYDCHNNANNCYFSLIYDELDEILYAKRYQNVLDQSISDFVSSEILERQIEEKLLNKIKSKWRLLLSGEKFPRDTKKDLDAVLSIKKSKQKKTFKKYDKRHR